MPRVTRSESGSRDSRSRCEICPCMEQILPPQAGPYKRTSAAALMLGTVRIHANFGLHRVRDKAFFVALMVDFGDRTGVDVRSGCKANTWLQGHTGQPKF